MTVAFVLKKWLGRAARACVVVSLFLLTPTMASAAVGPVSMTAAATGTPLTLTNTEALPGGDVATTWTAPDGSVVKAAGLPGSVVSLTTTINGLVASVAPPPNAPDSIQAYNASGRSLYAEATAVGFSASAARSMALADGAAVPATANGASLPASSAGTIFNSNCATVWGGPDPDVKNIYGHSCLVQTWLQTGAGNCGCWYSSNKITTTGYSEGTPNLTQLQGWNCYCNGHSYTTVAWAPSATRNEGTPTTYTLTAGFGGLSTSIQETQYPATLKPIVGKPSGGSFGSQWNGSNGHYTEDSANSVAIVHTCVYCTGDSTARVGIGWA